jgi:prophage regulatory protein
MGTMLLTVDDVLAYLQISRTHLYNLMREDKFPASIKVGQSVRWQPEDIEAWIQERKEASRANAS